MTKPTPKPPKPPAVLYLDAGHGGLMPQSGKISLLQRYTTYQTTRGKYFKHVQTDANGAEILPFWDGKRVDFHGEGYFFEGVENRRDAELLINELQPYVDAGKLRIVAVYEEVADWSLSIRTDKANKDWAAHGRPPALFYSLHYNAAKGDARGIMLFTSEGRTRADVAASYIIDAIQKQGIGLWQKGQKDSPCLRLEDKAEFAGDYEENFAVLRNSLMPAVLREGGFFTTTNEALHIVYDLKNYKLPLIAAEAVGIARFLGLLD